MAARSALPCSVRVWVTCAHLSPALVPGWPIRPARCADVLRAASFYLFFSFSHANSHFSPVRPISLIFARSGRRRSAVAVRRQKFAIFYSLRRRAWERRRGALKVIAYTLYAMSNSPPCVMLSGMALFLRSRSIRPLPLGENMWVLVLFPSFLIAFLFVSLVCRLPLQFWPIFFQTVRKFRTVCVFPGSARLARFYTLPFPMFSRSRTETILPTSAKWSFFISGPYENGFWLFPAPLCDFFTSLPMPLLIPLHFLSCFFLPHSSTFRSISRFNFPQNAQKASGNFPDIFSEILPEVSRSRNAFSPGAS